MYNVTAPPHANAFWTTSVLVHGIALTDLVRHLKGPSTKIDQISHIIKRLANVNH